MASQMTSGTISVAWNMKSVFVSYGGIYEQLCSYSERIWYWGPEQ